MAPDRRRRRSVRRRDRCSLHRRRTIRHLAHAPRARATSWARCSTRPSPRAPTSEWLELLRDAGHRRGRAASGAERRVPPRSGAPAERPRRPGRPRDTTATCAKSARCTACPAPRSRLTASPPSSAHTPTRSSLPPATAGRGSPSCGSGTRSTDPIESPDDAFVRRRAVTASSTPLIRDSLAADTGGLAQFAWRYRWLIVWAACVLLFVTPVGFPGSRPQIFVVVGVGLIASGAASQSGTRWKRVRHRLAPVLRAAHAVRHAARLGRGRG